MVGLKTRPTKKDYFTIFKSFSISSSEGIDANYMDMINYAVFAMIKIEFENEEISL